LNRLVVDPMTSTSNCQSDAAVAISSLVLVESRADHGFQIRVLVGRLERLLLIVKRAAGQPSRF
jgi:hypothetical protein